MVATLTRLPWPQIGQTVATVLRPSRLFRRWSYLNTLFGILVLVINHYVSVSHSKKSLSFTAMDLCRIGGARARAGLPASSRPPERTRARQRGLAGSLSVQIQQIG